MGEIETVLKEQEGVEAAAVIVERREGPERVVAYVVGAELETNSLRAALRERLPEVMVPAQFVFLDKMPLTPNGKVDRKALPAVRQEAGGEDAYEAARTPVEEMLAELWCEVLGVERVGIRDNFFDLGGHSLLATQLMSRISSNFRVELPLRRLFESPNIAELAAVIEEQQAGKFAAADEDDDIPEIQVVPRGKENLGETLARLEQLSEEELAKMISEKKL
ncbi:MAG TPA: phosphopantetheine-binding protein [Pyrinomonadaceae bacterium]|nr:phosphopantetheine-binding protein [Pyrinomonadaceae bacterium]